MGFQQGLSGLNAAAESLDVIGHNIANSATSGFKSGTATFADIYASSRVGLGVKVTGVTQRFTVGSISETGGQYDMAIDGSQGFFRLVSSDGTVVYSRDGKFHADSKNNLLNAQGYQLTGYPANGIGLDPIRLSLPTSNIAPVATSTASTVANLRAGAAVIDNTTNPFDPANATSYTDSVHMTIYDSLGKDHVLTQYFVKRAASGGQSVYDVNYYIDGTSLTSPAAGNTHLKFDNAGKLVDPNTGIVPLTYDVPPTNSPAATLSFPMNYTGTTQFGSDFISKVDQNGYTSGAFTGITTSKNGDLLGSYSNGKSQVIGTVVLADFKNYQGLQPIGDNAWVETSDSGPPALGQPSTNGLASIKGQSFEESNVDMSRELVNMIVSQRNYQANAQTVKTQDQILQTLLQIR